MLNEKIIKIINGVNSVEEFNFQLNKFKLSDASQNIKDEAIKVLKARKSCFDLDPNFTPAKVFQDIKAGMADIDDLA